MQPSIDLVSIEEKLKPALFEIEQFWDRYDSDERASCKKNSVRSYSYPARIGHGNHTKYSEGYNNQTLLHHRFWWTYDYDKIDEDKEELVPNVQSHSQFMESSRIRAAEKTWLVRKKALDQTLRPQGESCANGDPLFRRRQLMTWQQKLWQVQISRELSVSRSRAGSIGAL